MLRQSVEIFLDGCDSLPISLHGVFGRRHAAEADGEIEIGAVDWEGRSCRSSLPLALFRGEMFGHDGEDTADRVIEQTKGWDVWDHGPWDNVRARCPNVRRGRSERKP